MSYMTIKQPNGLLAVFSTVVDDFVHLNLSIKEVMEVYRMADERYAKINLAFCWAKLSPQQQAKEVEEFLAEGARGLREDVERVSAGGDNPDWHTWDYAVELVRVIHGRIVTI